MTDYIVYTSDADMTGDIVSFSDSVDLIRLATGIKSIRCFGFPLNDKSDVQIERATIGSFYVYLPNDEYDIQQIADIVSLIEMMEEED